MISIGMFCAVMAVISTAGNAADIVTERGQRQANHVVMVVLVILALLAFGLGWPPAPTRIVGLLLTLMAFSMFLKQVGYERLCCAAQMSFGLTALVGLPFIAA